MKCTFLSMISIFWTTSILLSGCASITMIAIGGSGWDKIGIVDKKTEKLIWTHNLEKSNECNSIYVDRNKNILYSYKQGARLISLGGTVVWDYKTASGTEVQYASPSSKGGYYLGICGNPAKIVELAPNGKPIHEIAFTIEAQNVHMQFRQICEAGDGGYFVPGLNSRELIKVEQDGSISQRIPLDSGITPFSVKVLTSGNFLISGGNGHCFEEITPDGKLVGKTGQNAIEGLTLAYVAQINIDDKGNKLICNWLGHGAKSDGFHLIETDKNNHVIWTLGETEGIVKVSTASQFKAEKRQVW